ncbi:MAG: GFA family protein [Polyangiaceae bacterium]
MQGECRCGRVQIRVTRPPLVTSACHCRGCQRMSSSAFSLTGIFPSDGFEVTRGEPVIGGLHGADAHFFCAYCMTWLFTRPQVAPQIVNVRSTMFDDATWSAPFIETFTKTQLPWAITGAVHSFEEFPPMSAFEGLVKAFASQ